MQVCSQATATAPVKALAQDWLHVQYSAALGSDSTNNKSTRRATRGSLNKSESQGDSGDEIVVGLGTASLASGWGGVFRCCDSQKPKPGLAVRSGQTAILAILQAPFLRFVK